jgi:hypothetical protein
MNHIENLRNSKMVYLPLKTRQIGRMHNLPGLYWSSISNYIFGLHDVRARLGTFTNPWGAVSSPDVAAPSLTFTDDKLSDLLHRRAWELLIASRDQGRPLAVMWSGGIDSTAVLTSLITNCTNPDQIVVYLSTKSIFENPSFYKNHISGKFRCVNIRDLDVNEDFLQNNILIHGDPGDCLFGPSTTMFKHLMDDGLHMSSWRDNKDLLIGCIESRNSMPGFAEWYVDKVSNNIEEVGLYEINSIADWWWWHYFNLKWEFSLMRPFFNARKDLKAPISRETFQSYLSTTYFNTDYFQNWSYSNLPRLTATLAEHKLEVKQYIWNLDPHDYYRDNKTKTQSISGIISNRPAYMDENFVSYNHSELGVTRAITTLLDTYRG